LTALFEGADRDVRQRIESDTAQALYAAAANSDREALPVDPAHLVRDQIAHLKKGALLAEEARILEAIRQADPAEDRERVVALMGKKVDLRRQIEAVGTI